MQFAAPNTPSELSATSGSDDWFSQVRQVVTVLDDLLRLLYEPPNSLDIITYHDILRVYRLTGLGAPATAAIDKSQRIVRTQGDYRQRGLCEFHIGMIYLYWGDCRGSAQQFVIARHQWLFVNDAAGVALAHFAHGQAMFHAYHYEAAMSSYGKVERSLARSEIAPQSQHNNQFVAGLRKRLAAAEERARNALWPANGEEQPAGADAAAGRQSTSAEDADKGADTSSATDLSPPRQAVTVQPTPAQTGGATGVALPYSNLPFSGEKEHPTPAPGHRLVDERYQWCQIVGRRGDLAPGNFVPGNVAAVPVGAWLLLDTRIVRHRFEPGQLLVLGSDRENWGQTLVWPVETQPAFNFYYLGRVLASGVLLAETDRLAVALDEPGGLEEVMQKQIIGIFVGAWTTTLA